MSTSNTIRSAVYWVAAGVIITAILWWAVGGYGIWVLPGMLMIVGGLSLLLIASYKARYGNLPPLAAVGVTVTVISLGILISGAGQAITASITVWAGIILVISVIVAIIGMLPALQGSKRTTAK